ncbi:MAG: S41 family peptidase [Candidatus Kapabacteria bacterium]|nr:S41 family peptidase [Candidatus Kapabacteria bacterium]
MKKTALVLVGIIIGIVAGIFIAQRFMSRIPGLTPTREQARKFESILENAEKNYVDSVKTRDLTETAIKAMLSELDPHSVYVPASLKQREREDLFGSFEGIGIQFEIINDTITVATPIIGGPSEKLGIRAGDKIVKIDGKNAIGLADTAVVRRLKGEKGTQVTVSIKRGMMTDLVDFTITRDKIPIYSVSAAFLIPNTDIGYISVNQFRATMFEEFVQASRKLRSEGMKRMILDLRGNPGGLLEQAYEMADAFIPDGKKIVYTKGRDASTTDEYIGTGGGEFEDIPLIILIDAGSASASEIVAGAVQDLDRGLIVGETSFGKGLVQRSYDMSDGSSYRLTVSRYYTPSGRSIQRDYKDAKKYRALQGRTEAEEGDNFTHKEKGDSSRPAFKTLGGRVVYGGGGIVPDYVVKHDTATKLLIELASKVLREFTDAYISENGEQLRKQYQTEMPRFLSSYTVSNEAISRLGAMAEKKGIQWNEAQYKTDERTIKTYIKAQIARNIWNLNEKTMVDITADKQVQKAIQLFPEVQKLAKNK